MNLSIAVCDDTQSDAAIVCDIIRRWGELNETFINLSVFSSAEEFLFHYADNKSYDIIVLDVIMKNMSGVELAQRLRRDNEILQIVFVTGYSDYISFGYDVSALHYLIKPVSDEKLFGVLTRALDKIKQNEKTITIHTGGEVVRIPVYKIKYADVNMNYVTVHADNDYTFKMTLSELCEMLDSRFYRIGRSVVVNLTCIARVTKKDLFLVDGTSIQLPRGAYESVYRAIIEMR